MDLRIAGRKALICAASKGIGFGCALALAREGAVVTITGRDEARLKAAQEAIQRETGAKVAIAPGDIATEQGRMAALTLCPELDILVNNAGGPPAGDFRDFGAEAWEAALATNMLAPIALIRATIDGMIARRFGRIVNVTSSAVKAPIAVIPLSNGARAGLTGFVAGLARDVVRHNVTINNILPGSIATDRTEQFLQMEMKERGVDRAAALARQEAEIPAGRFGTIDEFGRLCAYLCGADAGYITGQNILIDGGAYPGTF